jgi:ATP-dependent Lhr-like helicase
MTEPATGMEAFHPVVQAWFTRRFGQPTDAQRLGWPAIASGRDTLIAAPTGSGKTLAAFLTCLDRLLRLSIAGELGDELRAVYISPLRALTNDVRKNLELPLEELRLTAFEMGYDATPLRIATRSSDTPPAERQAIVRKPPHLLVTTPESLYLLLTGAKSRGILASVDTVILDEIHSLARDKRGTHLMLSLQRLEGVTRKRPVRIGLSATQKPIEQVARFLVGTARVRADLTPDCHIVDTGHRRPLDLAVCVPERELQAVCSGEQWAEVYDRVVSLIEGHRSTLVFTNTRRMAERIGHQLSERLGERVVATHHGSLSKDTRLDAEQRLKHGQLKAIVATASLELGIDVGAVDLVIQLGTPRSISTFLQRIGRSGHTVGGLPKGRIFALTRDDLLECLALIRAIKLGRLDATDIPEGSTDILAQQILAECATGEQDEAELLARFRGAWPYRELTPESFGAVIEMMSDRHRRSEDRGAVLVRDRLQGKLRASRGQRLLAICSGGAIPDQADYRVLNGEDNSFVGTVNEDFAIDSMAGDIFLLGNASWRIRQVTRSDVIVDDAKGQPATIPFWFGEAPGRTFDLSIDVGEFRRELAERVDVSISPADLSPATAWLAEECAADPWAAKQAASYVAAQKAAFGLVPTCDRIVFERFFDEMGGMQLVIHAPFGARINRAWGLAMRKRFCRSFDFELQAAADDNGIVLSLGPQHSFPIDDLFGMLNPENCEHMLTQALLAVPIFQTRFRWNATRALMVLRNRKGQKVPPALQRFHAEHLLTALFPAQTACFEHRPEDMEIPDHPLVKQTVHDCLHEAMDLPRWKGLLERVRLGQIEFLSRDTREPSPFSHELLNSNPYTFLDDAPLEERRARAVATRRTLDPDSFRELAMLDRGVIEQVRAEARPTARGVDELQDLLSSFGVWIEEEADRLWVDPMRLLVDRGRAGRLTAQERTFWFAAEHLPEVRASWPEGVIHGEITLPEALDVTRDPAESDKRWVRGQLELLGPTDSAYLARRLRLSVPRVDAALVALEVEGFVLRGSFLDVAADPFEGIEGTGPQWCERRLLARIHRLTLDGARRAIRPVEPADYLRFLMKHQRLEPGTQTGGRDGVLQVIRQFAGLEMPAGFWESGIFKRRVTDYNPAWLDELCLQGEVGWGRLAPPKPKDAAAAESADGLAAGDGREPLEGVRSRVHANGRSTPSRVVARGSRRAAEAPPASYSANGRAAGDARSVSPSRGEGLSDASTNRLVSPLKPGRAGGLTRVVPISIFPRESLAELLPADRHDRSGSLADGPARLHAALRSRGALFFSDAVRHAALSPEDAEGAISRLAALGLVSADGFAGIRGLALEAKRKARRRRFRPRVTERGIVPAKSPASLCGRWSTFPPEADPVDPKRRAEHWGPLLLARYGVVFRDLALREPSAPPWADLRAWYRRAEARGEIRGGRFISGVSGEQFALPSAVEALRRVRDEAPSAEPVFVSAADPVNLFGVITKDERIPALAGHELAILGGKLVGWRVGDDVRLLDGLDPALAESIRTRLSRRLQPRRRVRASAWDPSANADAADRGIPSGPSGISGSGSGRMTPAEAVARVRRLQPTDATRAALPIGETAEINAKIRDEVARRRATAGSRAEPRVRRRHQTNGDDGRGVPGAAGPFHRSPSRQPLVDGAALNNESGEPARTRRGRTEESLPLFEEPN